VTYFAIFPNIYGKKHKVLGRLEPIQEFIRKANDGGTRQKHPNKI